MNSLVFDIKLASKLLIKGLQKINASVLHSASRKRKATKMKLNCFFLCVFFVLMVAHEGRKIYFTVKSWQLFWNFLVGNISDNEMVSEIQKEPPVNLWKDVVFTKFPDKKIPEKCKVFIVLFTSVKSNYSQIYQRITLLEIFTAWKVSKYGVIFDPYFPVFGLNAGKYGPEITPYLDTFHAVFRTVQEKTRKNVILKTLFESFARLIQGTF